VESGKHHGFKKKDIHKKPEYTAKEFVKLRVCYFAELSRKDAIKLRVNSLKQQNNLIMALSL